MKLRERKHRHLVLLTGLMVMIGFSNITTAYAAEPNNATQQQAIQQSDRWEGAGDTWKVRTADNSGYLTNSWFQDLDSSWYMLGADGVMFSGIITDQSTGKSYLLNTNHDGTYGRMLTVDGVYRVNGQQVYLTFNQSHDGTFGAITNGLSEVRNSGVRETVLTSIPTDSTGTQTQNNNSQGQQQSWDIGNNSSKGGNIDLGNDGTDSKKTTSNTSDESWKTKPFDQMTDEEMDKYIEWRSGGGITVDKGGTIDPEANKGMDLQTGSNTTSESTPSQNTQQPEQQPRQNESKGKTSWSSGNSTYNGSGESWLKG